MVIGITGFNDSLDVLNELANSGNENGTSVQTLCSQIPMQRGRQLLISLL